MADVQIVFINLPICKKLVARYTISWEVYGGDGLKCLQFQLSIQDEYYAFESN